MAFAGRACVALAPVVFIAACQGGDGGNQPLYQTWDSNASVTSDVAAVALRTDATGAVEVTQSTGTITHDTGGLTLDDGTYVFEDANGPSIIGTYSDGQSVLLRRDTTLDTSGYEYVVGYTQVYVANGVAYEANGLAGVATRTADIPTTGTATYTGNGFAVVTSQTGAPILLNQGTSTVGANFGSGTVDATLNNFVSVTDAAGNAVTAPIDTIIAAGMAINGNTFSGGTVVTLGNGVATSVTGAPTTIATGGAFYGFDPDIGGPDEVGGMITVVGPNGSITGGFVAD